MQTSFRKPVAVSLAALGVALCAGSSQADYLPGLTNQDFSVYTGATPKARFTQVNPTGWTYTSGGGNLVFIDGQSFAESAAGPVYLTTYGNPTDLIPSVFLTPNSNYVEADGNPSFEDGFQYTTITGLTVGKIYSLTFYQGASQQTTFNGDTTNQWIVSLGTKGMQVGHMVGSTLVAGCTSSNPTCVYFNSDPNASIKASPLMTVPSHGTVGWEAVSLSFTADATTQELSFLAWGDNGNTTNLPPMAFLAGVDSPNIIPTVPEPSTWAMMIVGFLGIGGMAWRRVSRPALASRGANA
jgi:hypothetical protein